MALYYCSGEFVGYMFICIYMYTYGSTYVYIYIRTLELGYNTVICATPQLKRYTDMRRLTTGIRYEKCAVRRFRRCANVTECTYTNLDSTV